MYISSCPDLRFLVSGTLAYYLRYLNLNIPQNMTCNMPLLSYFVTKTVKGKLLKAHFYFREKPDLDVKRAMVSAKKLEQYSKHFRTWQ